jgi:ubiquitin carboxyl-terminal hydrolase L5
MSGDGWCTIESDPGVFWDLLQQVGTNGVDFTEVYDMENFDLSASTYGLIFLFKWRETETGSADLPIEFPPGLFFANQVITNACATQAVLSVVMNAPGIELGPELTALKEFTADFDPRARGLTIGNSEVIR